jgi:hypothetical protein
MTTLHRICPAFLIVLLCASAVGAPKTPATGPPQQANKVLVLDSRMTPADIPALKYGAALETQASAELKRWVRTYARKNMGRSKIDLAAVRAAVDARYPSASAAARDAVVYLLLYTAYKRHCMNLAETERIMGLPSNNPLEVSDTSTAPRASTGQAYDGEGVRNRDLNPVSSEQSMTRVYEPAANMRAVGAHLPRLRARVEMSQSMLSEAFKQMGAIPPNVLRKIR